AFVPLEAALRRDHLGEIHALQAWELAGGLDRRGGINLLARHDAAGLRARLTQDACQAPGVDACDRHDASALQELAQRLVGAPVARPPRQIADDETGREDLRGLEVFRRAAGVADVRTGERDDLAGVGRVGEDLLIPRQCGIENDFARGVALGTNRLAAQDGAIRQCQYCGLTHFKRTSYVVTTLHAALSFPARK